jgi:hypothetical protein
MGKLVTTAIRASPLRCRMHPFHRVGPFGQLARLSVSFARTACFWAFRGREALRKRLSSSVSLSEILRGALGNLPGVHIAGGIREPRVLGCNCLPGNVMGGISHNSWTAMEAN